MVQASVQVNNDTESFLYLLNGLYNTVLNIYKSLGNSIILIYLSLRIIRLNMLPGLIQNFDLLYRQKK